ncbi:MAG: hypothetical protein WCF19_01160 [Chlamydiales bacterium]
MKTSDKIQNFLKNGLFGAVVSSVYCALFMLIAKQFGLTMKDYAIWMGLSAGVVVSIFNPFVKKSK